VRILQILHGEALGGMEKFCIELTNALAEYNEVFFLVNSKLQEGISSKVHIIEFGSDIKKKQSLPSLSSLQANSIYKTRYYSCT